MKIYIASDHGGFNLKEELKKFLADLGHSVEDLGAHTLDPNDDYPDFVIPLAQRVALRQALRPRAQGRVAQGRPVIGIVIGRSGNGEAIAANKIRGIRAALATSSQMAKKVREHNNANILSLGADYINSETAKNIVKVFIETPFSNEERHKRRLQKISEFEKSLT